MNRKENTMIMRSMVLGFAVLFFISTGLAIELFGTHPSSDFLNTPLAMKTEKGTENLSLTLIEFVSGIGTSKRWEQISDNNWRLMTEYRDPVAGENKQYTLDLRKKDALVVLSDVSFNGHILSHDEMRAFVRSIIRNYEQRISTPK
jgi:hypothetical protein